MLAGLRAAYLVTAIVLLLILPFGDAVLLVLFVAVDLAAAALLLRQAEPPAKTVLVVGADDGRLGLLRRTVPALRKHRPTATVEAQVRWREAVKARRRFQIVS